MFVRVSDQILAKDVPQQHVRLANEDLALAVDEREDQMASTSQDLTKVSRGLECLYEALGPGTSALASGNRDGTPAGTRTRAPGLGNRCSIL